jgi:putative inorganic carbon (HCO3(-)) transporter
MSIKSARQTGDWFSPLFSVMTIILGGTLVSLLALHISDPILLLALVIGPIVVFGIALKPESGLLLLIFLTYTRTSDVLIDSLNAPSIAKPYVALLLLIIVARWVLYRQPIKGWQRPAIFLVSYGAIGLLSLLYAADQLAVEQALEDFAKDAVIMIIVVVLLQRATTLHRTIWALLVAGLFLGTITTYQQLTGTFENSYWGFAQVGIEHIVGDTNDYRVGGPGLGPNGYGQFMLFLVPLALERLWNEDKPMLRTLAGWALAVCLLTVLFTFSRGVFLGLVVALGLMFIRRPPKPIVMISTIVLAVILLQFAPARYTDRVTTLVNLLPSVGQDARTEVSFRGRLSENIAGTQMFMDRPFLGVGLKNYQYHYQSYSRQLGLDPRRETRSAHNLYLEFASELGFLGLAWFIMLQWVTFYGLREAQKNFSQANMPTYQTMTIAFGIALVSFLVTSIFRHMAYPRYVWLIYGIGLAIPTVSRNALASTVPSGLTPRTQLDERNNVFQKPG